MNQNAPTSTWAVIAMLHPNCPQCQDLVEQAVTTAQVTGSNRGAATVEHRSPTGSGALLTDHSAVVARALMVVTR